MSKKRKSPRLPVDTKMLIRKQAKKEMLAARNTIADEVAECAIIALAVAAHDEMGLKDKALEAFVNKFMLQFDCLIAGTVELEDLRQMLRDEAGVDFKRSEVASV